jgi:16S rRNA processing protein RimM
VNWDEMAAVGRIARAHGIRGQVIVNPDTDFPHERFHPGARLFARRAGGQGSVETLTVTTARFQQGRPVIGLEGVEDMNAAIALAGTELRVPVERLAPLPEGTFYRHDLVDCAVETTAGERVGLVAAVEGTLGDSRLVVATPGGEVLIPMVAAICTTIDPGRRRIVIAPPDGLLELNTKAADRKAPIAE